MGSTFRYQLINNGKTVPIHPIQPHIPNGEVKMKRLTRNFTFLICSLVWVTSPLPVSAINHDSSEAHQLKTLFHPSTAQLKREAKGSVYIYDGLTDKTVHEALDKHPGRIQSMMFTNIKITDSQGMPLRDPLTGTFLLEEDGCD